MDYLEQDDSPEEPCYATLVDWYTKSQAENELLKIENNDLLELSLRDYSKDRTKLRDKRDSLQAENKDQLTNLLLADEQNKALQAEVKALKEFKDKVLKSLTLSKISPLSCRDKTLFINFPP